MAAAEVVRWSSVVGEYGVLLTEMGSMEDLHSPIKPYPRIKVCGVVIHVFLFQVNMLVSAAPHWALWFKGDLLWIQGTVNSGLGKLKHYQKFKI